MPLLGALFRSFATLSGHALNTEAFTHLFHPLPPDQVPAATLLHPGRGFQNPISYSSEEASHRSASTEQTLPCGKLTEAQCMGLFLATQLFPRSSPGPNAAECKAETLGGISQAQRRALSVKPATYNPSEDGLLPCMWDIFFPCPPSGYLTMRTALTNSQINKQSFVA